MRVENDERHPWQGGEPSSRLAGRAQSATTRRVSSSSAPHVDLRLIWRAAAAEQRRRLIGQLERAAQQRRSAGDREGAILAAAWTSEARGAA
jgi:hypothetical protein